MKRLTLTLGLVFFGHNAFALKYMCQQAVRGNSGKLSSVKGLYESYQSNGEFAAKKQELLNTLDNAVAEIQKADCPMDDSEVTKVINPIKQLRAEIYSATANATAATSTSTSISSASTSTEKISYPCRQILQRQSGKPNDFERTLAPLRDAVKSGQTVGNIVPGFLIDTKIEAALSDLNQPSCPLNHPDFKTVIDQLEAQKKELPIIYAELKKRLDSFAKLVDVNNYPDYKKDTEIFDIIANRYRNASNCFNSNIEFNWVDPKDNSALMGNIKSPIYSYDELKNLLENMITYGNEYNNQMKLVESKYKDLLSANKPLATQYVRSRDEAGKVLGGFYQNELETLKKVLATTIDHNFKVLELATKDAVERRSPEFFRGETVKNILKSTTQALELFGLTGKENREKAPGLQSKFSEINSRLKETQNSLAELMLKEQRLGKEKYTGSDIESLRAKITEKFKEEYPDKELIKIHMANEDWKVTNYVSWSSGHAYRHHYSELGFFAVVKESAEIAILVDGWYHVNHQQRDKISVSFTFHKPTDMYQNRKILIKNL